VVVLDDGIMEHAEFPTPIRVIDTTEKTGRPKVNFAGHGTQVMSIMASKSFGIAPEAEYVMIKVYNDDGDSSSLTILKGLRWVMEEKIRNPSKKILVNLSMATAATPECDLDFMLALEQLHQHDILTFVSAGNQAENACSYSPGCAAHAITVGASTMHNQIWYEGELEGIKIGSNTGGCVDLFAPGRDVRMLDGKTGLAVPGSGTSMSAPYVTGVAAVLVGRGYTMAQIRTHLLQGATPGILLGAKYKGYNRVLYVNKDGTLPGKQFFRDTTPLGPGKARVPPGPRPAPLVGGATKRPLPMPVPSSPATPRKGNPQKKFPNNLLVLPGGSCPRNSLPVDRDTAYAMLNSNQAH
jgi:subtilisin family serine protease